MRPRSIILFPSLLCFVASIAVGGSASPLTFEERVDAQRAIEEVYWQHRIWPDVNPEAKPSLSAVMPEQAIRGRDAQAAEYRSKLP